MLITSVFLQAFMVWQIFCLILGGMQLKYEEASQVATDAVGGIRTVAAFSAEKKVMEAYEKKCESPIKQGIREGVVRGLGFGFSFLAFYFTYALCSMLEPSLFSKEQLHFLKCLG